MDIPIWQLTSYDKQCFQWKYCSWCRQHLPCSPRFFHRNRNTKDGYVCRCKYCVRILAIMGKPQEPGNTPEQNRKVNALQDRHNLLARIARAARDAEYAADGIVLDGRKLSIPIKVCSDCAVQYPATTDHFNRCKQSKRDGLSGKCKDCINTPRRKRRKANRSRMFSTKSLYS